MGGYLVASQKEKKPENKNRLLVLAAKQFLAIKDREKRGEVDLAWTLVSKNESSLRQLITAVESGNNADSKAKEIEMELTVSATILKERVEDNSSKRWFFPDIVLVVALAQNAFYQLLAGQNRIPLPDATTTCYTSDGPGLSQKMDDAFAKFGQENTDLLQHLNIHFSIVHQFSFNDWVPVVGQTHLGVKAVRAQGESLVPPPWLHFKAFIFKPKPGFVHPALDLKSVLMK